MCPGSGGCLSELSRPELRLVPIVTGLKAAGHCPMDASLEQSWSAKVKHFANSRDEPKASEAISGSLRILRQPTPSPFGHSERGLKTQRQRFSVGSQRHRSGATVTLLASV